MCTTEVSQLSLPLCLGESDEIIDEHLIRAKIDVDSRETVGILVDSFAKKLGSWASDNAKLINDLNTVSGLDGFI
jgi:hypothetical protein